MSHTARLRKVGGSVMVAIPPAMLDELDLKPDASVDMTVKSGKLMLEASARPRFTLDELLAQCRSDGPMDSEERDWLDKPATGHEII